MKNKISPKYHLLILGLYIATFFLPTHRMTIVGSYIMLSITLIALVLFLIKSKEMISLKINKKDFQLIIFVYLLMLLAHYLIRLFIVIPTSGNQSSLVKQITGANGWVLILFVITYAPLMEEFVYRGVLQERISNKFGKITGLIIATLLFAFPHMFVDIINYISGRGPINWVGIIPYIISGLGFGYVYTKSNKLSVPIWLHFLNNSIALILIL